MFFFISFCFSKTFCIQIIISDASTKGKKHKRTSSTSTAGASSKLTEQDFSSSQYRLACLAKSRLRERIALENAWPDDNKEKFTWTSFTQAVKGNEAMEVLLKKCNKDVLLKDRLITYVRFFFISLMLCHLLLQ